MKHLYGKRNLNCEIHGPLSSGCYSWGQILMLKKCLLYSQTCEEKSECIDIMMSMKLFTKIVKFMTRGTGVQALGWPLLCHIPVVKMYEILENLYFHTCGKKNWTHVLWCQRTTLHKLGNYRSGVQVVGWEWWQCDHSVLLHILFKNLLLYFHKLVRKIDSIIMLIRKSSTVDVCC